MNTSKGVLFGGGARRVVVDRPDREEEEHEEEFVPAIARSTTFGSPSTRGVVPFVDPLPQQGQSLRSHGERETSGVVEREGVNCRVLDTPLTRLVVPRTEERQGRRKHATRQHHVVPCRRTSISQEFVPQSLHDEPMAPMASPVPIASQTSSRLSFSLAAAGDGTGNLGASSMRTCSDRSEKKNDPFLLAWLNSVLNPWDTGGPSCCRSGVSSPSSSVAIYTHKNVLKDRIARQWLAMDGKTRACFVEPILKIAQRLARNPVKVAKAMESAVRTAVTKHQVMEALGSYSRVWFEVASDLLNGDELLSNHLSPLSPSEKTWLRGLIGRQAGRNPMLQAFAKLSPEGYCRVSLHVIAIALFLDRIFASPTWSIPVWAPPLFSGNSIRSTKDVLQSSVGFFLDQMADVMRWLGRSDYLVSYVQPLKHCMSLGVENMAVDLRDGVVLCRLAELLVPDCERLKPLYPATKTSERICNIELALLKLGMRDYVEARLVADGNEAATTGLLWNCVVRFELESALNVNAIAVEVARLGGGVVVGCGRLDIHDAYLRALLDMEIRSTSLSGRSAAGHVLRWACCLYNTAISGTIIEEDMSDHPLGGPAGRRRFLESFLAHYGFGDSGSNNHGARSLKSLARTSGPDAPFMKKVDYLLKPLGKEHGMPRIFSEEELMQSSEPLDQRRLLVLYALLLKRVLCVHHEQRAAVVIQRSWRRYVIDQKAPDFARRHLQMWIEAAKIIQRNVRPFLVRQRIEASRASRVLFRARIIRIQAIWRQKMQRGRYEAIRASAVVIQTQWRAHVGRTAACARKAQAERENSAAVIIQAHWRAFTQRRSFDAKRQACLKIQSVWRMAQCRVEFLGFRHSALVIQKHARRMLVERDLHARQGACVAIQTAWRAHHGRNAFLRMRSAAIAIQSGWRMAMGHDVASARIKAVLIIQRQWRAARQRRMAAISGALGLATLQLVDALTEFAAAYRADLQVDQAEKQRLDAARLIQKAWREYAASKLLHETSRHLLNIFFKASETVRRREAAAKEATRQDTAARAIQTAWRERTMVQCAMQHLMQIYHKAQQAVHLNEKYGAVVVKIQAHARGYLVRTCHPDAVALAAIRNQLKAATDRAEVLRLEGIDDPTTLGNMTRVALEGLHGGASMPDVPILLDLERCLGSSNVCCEHFIDSLGVQHLTSAVLKISRDRMREDSIEQALLCLKTLSACGRFSDRVASALLDKDGEDVRRLFQLLFQLKDNHELFLTLIDSFCSFGKSKVFCKAVVSSDELSRLLGGVFRALSVKVAQVGSYLANLQARRGSDVSIANATRTLYRMEKQTAAVAAFMSLLGVACADEVVRDLPSPTSGGMSAAAPATGKPGYVFMTPHIRTRAPVLANDMNKKSTAAKMHRTPRRVLGNISNGQRNMS